MRILLAGGTGFLGRHLVKELAAEGHVIVSLTRRKDSAGLIAAPNLRHVHWDGADAGALVRYIERAEAVVNLCGENMGKGRWNEARKAAFVRSRVGPTSAIVGAIAAASSKPRVLVNASAVGYYGNVEEGDVTEASPNGEGFVAALCARWEEAAAAAEASGVRVVRIRTGFVVAGKGSGLGRMILPFLLFVGGPIGSGRQWFPWVHVDDVVGAIRHALETDRLRGPVNVSAPAPVRMKEFSAALGKALRRPSWAPVPGFVARIVAGEVVEMALTGQKALPAALLASGYRFRRPDLADALAAAAAERREL